MSTLSSQVRRVAVGAGSAVAAAAVVVGTLGFFSAADPGRAATTSVDTTYLADTLGLPADTVIDTVTYDRFQWLLRQPGQFAFLIGSKTDPAFAAQAQAVDTAAKAAGATKVYWFDPNLTGETGVKNLDTRNPSGINLAASSQTIYGNVWRNVLGQSLGNGISSVSNAAGNAVTVTLNDAIVNDSVDPAWDFRTGQTQAITSTQNAFIVFDKDNTASGSADKIVDWVNLSTDATIAASLGDAFTAIGGGAVIDQVAEFEWWKSENNRIQSLSTPVSRYGGDILADADDDLGWNVEQLTYPELLHLLKLQDSADRNFVILFGGTWCPNTRAVIKFLNEDAVANGVKVYNFDLVLDGGKVNGTNGGSNPIHVRDNAASGATFNFRPSWVYGDMARTYLRNLITQYDPHAGGGNRVTYYPNGDLTAFPDVVRKLQVPFLVNYQRGTGTSPSSTAIKRQWIQQVVDPNTGLVTYKEYMTNWWFSQPSAQLGLSFAIPADESTLTSDQQIQLAQARANVAFAQEALTKLDEFFAGLPGTVAATPSLTAPSVGADTAPTVSLALAGTHGRTATGTATLTVNGSNYNAALASNAATFTLPKLPAGTYPLSVAYPGDANVSAFTATGSLTITAVPVYSAPEPTKPASSGKTTTIVVTVTATPSPSPEASASPSPEPSEEPSPSPEPSEEPTPSEVPLPSAPGTIVAEPTDGGDSGGSVTTWIIVGGGILGAAGIALGGIQFFRQRWGGRRRLAVPTPGGASRGATRGPSGTPAGRAGVAPWHHNERVTRRGFILFATLGVAWGIPYLFIKVAVGELSPEVIVFARSALAAVLLLPLAAFRKELMPVLRRWKPLLAYTAVELVVPWYLLTTAEQDLPSSTAGLLLAAVPLVGVAVAWLMGAPARFTAFNWLGVLLGMAGVGALVGFDVDTSHLGAVGLMAIVAVGYALGPAILSRWVPDLPGIGLTALSLAGAALFYAPVVAVKGSWPTQWPSTSVIVAIIVLAVICSALAFVLMIALIGEIGPVRSTAITYVNPAVAVLAGVVFLEERLTVWTVIGLGLVLAGSALATRRNRSLPVDTEDESVAATSR